MLTELAKASNGSFVVQGELFGYLIGVGNSFKKD
jgi:hypothetical protein